MLVGKRNHRHRHNFLAGHDNLRHGVERRDHPSPINPPLQIVEVFPLKEQGIQLLESLALAHDCIIHTLDGSIVGKGGLIHEG